jgi:hypothetical protein
MGVRKFSVVCSADRLDLRLRPEGSLKLRLGRVSKFFLGWAPVANRSCSAIAVEEGTAGIAEQM